MVTCEANACSNASQSEGPISASSSGANPLFIDDGGEEAEAEAEREAAVEVEGAVSRSAGHSADA